MAEKLRLREEIFALGQRRLAELNNQLKTQGVFEPIEKLNNAVILAYRPYLPSSSGPLQQAYEALDSNVPRLVELLLIMRESKEPPYLFLKRWLEERRRPSSS
jgi:hypothetical protein